MLCFLPCIKPTAFAAAAVHSIDRLSTHDASRIFYAMHTNTIAQRMIINWCIHNEIFNPTHCEMIFFFQKMLFNSIYVYYRFLCEIRISWWTRISIYKTLWTCYCHSNDSCLVSYTIYTIVAIYSEAVRYMRRDIEYTVFSCIICYCGMTIWVTM